MYYPPGARHTLISNKNVTTVSASLSRNKICSIASTHPGRLNLSGNRVLCIRVDGTHHRPVDTTARRTTVKKRWIGGVDGQVPRWKLRVRQCYPAPGVVYRRTLPCSTSTSSGDMIPL